uniref:family 78 glycoside hydrolase catalytic domain n=1 Tax=uncultured Draconibacterium sp. TaxID=1573823 RepID=UPI003217D830
MRLTTFSGRIAMLIFIASMALSCQQKSESQVVQLTCNFRENPLGIDTQELLLGWQIESPDRNTGQSAYRILVAEQTGELEKKNGTIWDSGKIDSDQSINVRYDGKRMEPGKRYFWKVKIWDKNGQESSWSETSWWQTGLFSESDWEGARWVAYEELDSSLLLVPGIHGSGDHLEEKAVRRPVVPQFRKSFHIDKKIRLATLSISGLGHYVSFLNGKKIGNSFLTPGWTDYDKTVLYNTFDVTSYIKPGENVIGAVAGNGFYNINRERYRKLVIAYGMPKLLAFLKLEYTDGTTEHIVTDESWKMAPSPTTFASIYGGEDYDANHEYNGWLNAGFDASAWETALQARAPSGKLMAEYDYPLKEMNRFEVKSISELQDGSFLYDFGQNASGIIELSVTGRKGQQVTLWPSELIHPDSSANQEASGKPYCFSYTLKGDGIETWKPKFTYYGFRYVQVKGGIPEGEQNKNGWPVIKKISFLHTRNSAPGNGTFLCSNNLLNQVHDLIDWGIRSNFQSVLTDCPHREKLGWLEQSYLMGQGVHFRYDIYHLYRKLVFDMMDAQTSEGLVPDIVPEYVEFLGGFRDSPEWGSAAVILPYLLYKWYGDTRIIDTAWPMMIRYVNYLKSKSEQHILNHGLGDWFDLGPMRPGVSQLTPISLTATASYFYDVKLMAEMAAIYNKPEEKMLKDWAEEIKRAFNTLFFNAETNVYSTGSQTAMSMPYCMEIVEEANREAVFANLTDSIIEGNKALTAGDVGFHYLVEALTKGEASQLMYEMINRDDVPGYGFQLKKGATALTESWQALENVSNNHLMLGHVMEWFYAGLAGIGQAQISVAYKNIEIRPQVAGDLTFVKASFHSPYGIIRSEWERSENTFQIEVEIPHNTTATVVLPSSDINSVTVNEKTPSKNIISKLGVQNKVSLSLQSGIYKISSDLRINQ